MSTVQGDVEDATDCLVRSALPGRRYGWNGRPRGGQERLVGGGERLGCGADFNNDGFADLAAAAPEEAVGAAFAAGAVSVLYGAGSGLSASGGQLFTQNSPGIPGTAEAFDASVALTSTPDRHLLPTVT